MAYFKAVTIHYKRKLIFVTIVLISNEKTEKNLIFDAAMTGHQESLKLRPRHLVAKSCPASCSVVKVLRCFLLKDVIVTTSVTTVIFITMTI